MKNFILTFLMLTIVAYVSGQTIDTAAIDSIYSDWDQPNAPGGAVGIIKEGELIYAKGYGLANLAHDVPNSSETVFRIGSISKQFTAACIVLLAQKGKLSLDDKLHEFFPEFPDYAKKITIRHLLHHTSGIRNYGTLARIIKGLKYEDYYDNQDLKRWLTNLDELNFDPGSEFLYCNSGYWLLGQIVKQVSGMNLKAFAQKELFDPLGMDNTHFHNDHSHIVKNRATGYAETDTGGYKIDMSELDLIGAGGLLITIKDIKIWDDAYYDSEILDRKFWDTMTQQAVLNNGERLDYALGLTIDMFRGIKTIRHGGHFAGYSSYLVRFPEHQLTIATFSNKSNGQPKKRVYETADLFLKEHYSVKGKYNTKSAIDNLLTIDSLQQVTGKYEVVPGWNVTFSANNDSLILDEGWNDTTFVLNRISENAFQFPRRKDGIITFSKETDTSSVVLNIFYTSTREVEKYHKKEAYQKSSNVDLTKYEGTYYNEALDASYKIFAKQDTLKTKIDNNEPFVLKSYKKDQFYYKGRLFRFTKQDDRIKGFKIDAGRVKKLSFVKKK